MTDIQSTPVPSRDFTVLDQNNREHARLADESLVANKTALFDALAAAGIEFVTVVFDGYGDSGQIENIEVRAGDELIALPPNEIEMARSVWGSSEIERKTQPVRDAIETLAYDLLGQTQSGWGNDEGPMATSPSMSPRGRSRSTTTSGIWSPTIPSTCFEEATVAHCYHHALSSAKKWGGTTDDYMQLHNWFDESKIISADFRHRALRHHAEGIFMLERFYGQTITLSTGRVVLVRLIGEQHVIEDLGFIPSFADWVRCIRPEPWMGRAQPIQRIVDPFAATS